MKRPLSHHQISTMRYIRDFDVLTGNLGQVHQGTLGALLTSGRIKRSGIHVMLTSAGDDLLMQYEKKTWNARAMPGPLTSRVETLLKLAYALKRIA